MEFETNGRTDVHTRTAMTSTDRRRHAVSTSLRLVTNGQTPQIIFAASVRPSVRLFQTSSKRRTDGRTDSLSSVRPSVS